MTEPAELTKNQLEDVIHRLRGRMEGRISMNRLNAQLHQERDVKLQAEARVDAYKTVLLDIDLCLKQEKEWQK